MQSLFSPGRRAPPSGPPATPPNKTPQTVRRKIPTLQSPARRLAGPLPLPPPPPAASAPRAHCGGSPPGLSPGARARPRGPRYPSAKPPWFLFCHANPGTRLMDTVQIPSPPQPYRVLGDIPPLQRIVVPVAVIVQPRLLIILLPRQPVRLVQVMRVLLIKLVAPFIILPAPRRIAVFADKRQRQAPVVTVVKMNFSLRGVFRLHLSGQLLHRQPALRKPLPAFTAHAVSPGVPPPASPAAPPAPPEIPRRARPRSLPAAAPPPGCGAALSPVRRSLFRCG